MIKLTTRFISSGLLGVLRSEFLYFDCVCSVYYVSSLHDDMSWFARDAEIACCWCERYWQNIFSRSL